MKVILTRDVKDLGQAGDVVNVADGYARNFLFPRKLAVQATPGNLEVVKRRQTAQAQRLERAIEEARELKERLDSLTVRVTGKVGTGTRLYGSITAQDIADALAREHNIRIDKRDIQIEEPIKSLGTYPVPVKLHREVTATLQVEVIGEG